MTFRSRPVRQSAFAAAFLAAAGLAGTGLHAQGGPPSRAFDRLFSPDPAAERARVSLSVYQGIDTLKDSQAQPVPDLADGPFVGLNPTGSFTLGQPRARVTVGGGSTLRRYAGTGSLALLSIDGNVNAQFRTERTGIKLRQTVGHAPFYDFLDLSRVSIGPTDDADVPSPDRAAYDRPLTTYISGVDFGRQLSRKLVLSANYGVRYSRLGEPTDPTGPTLRDPFEQSGSVQLRQQLDKYTVLVAGYGLRFMEGIDPQSAPLRGHDLQLGVDRSQQFAVLQRAVVSFSGGSTILSLPDGHRFLLTGSAAFHYDLSRTWNLSVAASRDVGYMEALADPVVSRNYSAAVGGLIGSRVELLGLGSYMTGDVGVGTSMPGSFHAYSGTLRMRGRITSGVAAYAEWTQYEHVFSDAVTLPGEFVRQRMRSGLRFGLVLSHSVRQPQERGEQ